MTNEAAVTQSTSTPQPAGITFIPDQPRPEDYLDFLPYVKALAELISSPQTKTPVTLGLFGTWGSGKTQLMMLIDEELKKRREQIRLELQKQLRRKPLQYAFDKLRGHHPHPALEPLWINVWKLGQQSAGKEASQGNGWQSFLQALFSQVHKKLPIHRRLWFDLKLLRDRIDLPETFRQLLANSYRLVIVVAPLILAKLPQPQNTASGAQDALTGLLQQPSFKGALALTLGLWLLVKPLVESAKEKVSLDLEKILREAPYETRISAIQQLEIHFDWLVKAWVGTEGRVVVFIDDLDRCPPDKMTEVLETLKLFATTEGCVYLLGVDQDVVTQSIRAKYKDLPVDGARYLEKIVQLPFLLPSIEVSDIESYVKSFKAGWPHDGCQDIFVKGLPPNPRQIKRATNVFFLLWSLAESRRAKLGGAVTAMRLAKIVALQTAHPEIFERMKLAPWLIKRIEAHLLKSPDEQKAELDQKLLDESLHSIVRQPIVQQLFTLHRDDPLAMFEKLDDRDLAAFFSLTRSVQATILEPETPAGSSEAAEGERQEKIVTTGEIAMAGKVSAVVIPTAPPAVSSLYQLPPPPRDFTGRERELSELLARVEQSSNLIICGLGGVGKSALALTLAERVKVGYPDAQFFLDMGGGSDRPLTVPGAMAQVIRAYYPSAKLPESRAETHGLYQSSLNNQRALILLDNAWGKEQVEPLIPPSGCLMIVTSRRHFTLPGFFTLNLDTLSPGAASELLFKIAPRIGDYADEIAELCGYLPLALRLVASALAERLNLSPKDYVERLRGAKERRDLVEASLSLSYEILTTELKRLWRQLAVFPESFDPTAAAAIWEMGASASLGALSELTAYSLVEWDEADSRYHLHNLLRLFAEIRLTDEERARIHKHHAEHFKDVAAAANDLYLRGGDELKQGIELFDLEWPNIHAGHSWAVEHAKQDDTAARLTIEYPDAAAHLLNLRLSAEELLPWQEAALEMARAFKLPQSESQSLSNLGLIYATMGEISRAVECFEKALAIAREIGDRNGAGAALGNLGGAYLELGEFGKAIELLTQQLEIARETGDRRGQGNALGNLGRAYYAFGEVPKAVDAYQAQLSIAREIGDRLGEGAALGNLAALYVELDRTLEAIEMFKEQLAIAFEIGDRRGEGVALFNSSLALNETGNRAEAIRLAERALSVFEEQRDPSASKVREQLEKWRQA